MDKVEIYSSKRKALLLLVGSLMFVLLGVFMFIIPQNSTASTVLNSLYVKGIGIAATLFFGLGIYVSVRQLIQNRLMLVIDELGIIVDPKNRLSERLDWKNIERFDEFKVQRSKFIAIVINNSEYWIEKEKNMIRKNSMKFNQTNYGSPFNISAHASQITYSELNELLDKSIAKYKHD